MHAEVELTQDEERLRPEGSEVYRLLADNSKARRIWQWAPQFGGREGFRRGLAETIAWFTEAENLRGYKTTVYNI